VFTFLVQAGVSCKWVNDSQHLLLEHFDAIHNSPSQIYHSILPLSPPSSWLHNCYTAESSGVVRVVKGLSDEWGACSCTVVLNSNPQALASWKDTLAVALKSHDILLLNAITGSQTAVLSGHTNEVKCLTFLPDGMSLVSGSEDKTLKLWDIQTGGVVRTFHDHIKQVFSVSISADCTMLASGSEEEICLWDIQTGICWGRLEVQGWVYCVAFSTTNPQHLISASSYGIQGWDIQGHKIRPSYQSHYRGFSSNGTHFVSCTEEAVTVQDFDSGAVVAKCLLSKPYHNFHCPCFSPDGKLVACAAGAIIYVWDITGLDPLLIKTFIGQKGYIDSPHTFSSPSTLVSASYMTNQSNSGRLVTLSTDSATGDPESCTACHISNPVCQPASRGWYCYL
jgi:WD40 repeat protein